MGVLINFMGVNIRTFNKLKLKKDCFGRFKLQTRNSVHTPQPTGPFMFYVSN